MMLWYVNVNCILNAIFYHSSLGLCVTIITTRVIAVVLPQLCYTAARFLFISGCRAQFTSLQPLSRDMCWQKLCMIASRCNSNSSFGCQIEWMMWDVVVWLGANREQWVNITLLERKERECDLVEGWVMEMFFISCLCCRWGALRVFCHCVMNFKGVLTDDAKLTHCFKYFAPSGVYEGYVPEVINSFVFILFLMCISSKHSSFLQRLISSTIRFILSNRRHDETEINHTKDRTWENYFHCTPVPCEWRVY